MSVQWHNYYRTRKQARTSKGKEKKKIPSLKRQRGFKEIKGISKGQLLPEKGRLNRAPALGEVADIQQEGWHTDNPDLILPFSLMSCQDYVGWTGSPSSRDPHWWRLQMSVSKSRMWRVGDWLQRSKQIHANVSYSSGPSHLPKYLYRLNQWPTVLGN